MISETSIPALRRDLVYSYPTEGSNARVVIKDPVAHRYFSLTATRLTLLQLCDGNKSINEISAAYSPEATRPLEVAQVASFILTVKRAGLLMEDRSRPERCQFVFLSALERVLYWRVKTIDPTRLLDAMVGYVGPFFTPSFLGLALALIIWAGYTVFVDRYDLGRAISVAGGRMWIAAFGASFVIAVFHEFAHAFTCRRWGGEVKEMGFLLIYFNPALYCNVSDAWLFPKRHQRLWTMGAGAVCEAFIWSVIVIAWRLAPTDSYLSTLWAFLILITGIRLIMNANPLIKLDGYYFLCDALQIPNLRKKAFRYVGTIIRRMASAGVSVPQVGRKEAVVYVGYCLLAFPFSMALAISMFVKTVRIATTHQGFVGWLLMLLLVLLCADPIIRAMAFFRDRGKRRLGLQTEAVTENFGVSVNEGMPQ